MKSIRFGGLIATIAAAFAAVVAQAADHLDAPNLQMVGASSQDINDLYVFNPSTDASNPSPNTVMVLTVNPFSGVQDPLGIKTSPRTFGTDVTYSFNIDNDGDYVADVIYHATFQPALAGTQAYTIARVEVGGATNPTYATGVTNVSGSVPTGGMVAAGQFEDPFFFDFVGFNATIQSLVDGSPSNEFTGADTFAGADVSALVLEVPSSELNDAADSVINVWATTAVGGVQTDRVGKPALNTALIPAGMKNAYNAGVPADDVAEFSDEVSGTIEFLSSAANAAGLTPALLPDVLGFDTSSVDGFNSGPLNGRRLNDDVIDLELTLLTDGFLTGDGVASNDAMFSSVFPYLAAPNVAIPEPATTALLLLAAAGGVLALRRRGKMSSN